MNHLAMRSLRFRTVRGLFVLLTLWLVACPALAQAPPSVKKWFGSGSIAIGETTSLTFQIVASDELTGIGFSDVLPPGLVVASPNGFSGFAPEGTCAGGVVEAMPGSGKVRLSGAALAGTSTEVSCTFSIDVTGVGTGPQHGSVTVWSDQSPGNTSEASVLVERASPGVIASSSAGSGTFGQPVTITVKVTAKAAAASGPRGEVTLTDGARTLGTGRLSQDGVATTTISDLPAGQHAIVAVYGGDPNFADARSQPVAVTVGKAPATTGLLLSDQRASLDESVDVTAVVTGSARTPTGSVSFLAGSRSLGTAQLSPEGRTTLSVKLPAGQHLVRASYEGDGDYLPSISPSHLLAVQPPIRTGKELQIAGAILLLLTVLVALALLLRNLVRALVAPAFRFVYGRLYNPIHRAVLRLLRFLRIVRRAPHHEKAVESFVGLSVGAIAHAMTETDAAIGKALGDQAIPLNATHRLFCSWIEPAVEQDTNYDKKRASDDLAKAREFFTATIPIDSNHLNLYDDIVGAFTVDLFKDSDVKLFYVLSEFRKAINANVVALSIVCSFVVAFIVIVNVVFSTSIDFHRLFFWIVTSYFPSGAEFLHATDGAAEIINRLAFAAIAVFIVGYPAMGFYYYLIYDAFQRNNGKGMDLLLTQYLASINSHFKEVHRNATQAVVEERTDIREVQSDVALWITNLQWMAFRVFFIEYFFRGLIFQMRRNASFALILVPLAVFVPALAIVFAFESFGIFPTLTLDIAGYAWFYLLVFVFMLFRYIRCRTDALEAIAGALTVKWFKFRELNLENAMSKIMESYINQLDQWRSRYRERGGPGS
jgi:hypothetical protein